MNHGTNTGYARGCRCQVCRKAHAQYQTYYIQRRDQTGGPTMLPALGAIRRVRALQRLGWPIPDIAEAVGWSRESNGFGKLLSDHTSMVTRSFHDRLDAAYERMSAQPGPSRQAQAHAVRKNWPPPFAWDNIDDPTETPTGMRTPASDQQEAWQERRAQITQLAAKGLTDRQIADQIGSTRDAVTKTRWRHGIKTGAAA